MSDPPVPIPTGAQVGQLAHDSISQVRNNNNNNNSNNDNEYESEKNTTFMDESRISPASSVTAGKASEPEDGISKGQEAELENLARQMSHISHRSSVYIDADGNPVNPFLDTETDPALNPHNEKFRVGKWLKNMLQITSRDPETYPKRTAGVSFQNMNVYGFGTAADYQADVGNTPLKAWGAIKSLFGGEKKVRIDILRNFEGLVKSGEMLVVLGRPGRYVLFRFCCSPFG